MSAEAHLAVILADQDGDYACAVGETHDFTNDLGVVFGADLFAGNTALIEVLLSRSTEGTAGRGVNDNLLWRSGNAAPFIEFVEFLDDELDVVFALIFPDARFLKLAIRLGLGEVEPN